MESKENSEVFSVSSIAKYPRTLCVDFKKLSETSLRKYVKTYHIHVRPDISVSDLVIICARHFQSKLTIDEEETVSMFIQMLDNAIHPLEPVRYSSRRPIRKKTRREEEKTKERDDSSRNGKRRKRTQNNDIKHDPNQAVYCVCRQISYGEMIGCDDPDCDYEWFHIECVGLSPDNKPRGKWFCPICRERSHTED